MRHNNQRDQDDEDMATSDQDKQLKELPGGCFHVIACALAGFFYGIVYSVFSALLFAMTTTAAVILFLRPSTETLVVILTCLFAEHAMNVALQLFGRHLKPAHRLMRVMRYIFSIILAVTIIVIHRVIHELYVVVGVSLAVCAMTGFMLAMAFVDLMVIVPRNSELTPLTYVSKVHSPYVMPMPTEDSKTSQEFTKFSCIHCAHCKTPV